MANFSKSFTQQLPIPDAAIKAAERILKSGRLHRYNIVEGELGEVAQLEKEYALYQGSKYCLAVASGGQAMQIAMRASGVGKGGKVLTNAFTLAPVPGAIHSAGAEPILIETNENLLPDMAQLKRLAAETGAQYLLLSHMRGHIPDMDHIVDICRSFNITLIEDCAHTMGATFGERKSGCFGIAGCFSTQTYKHINSGEGGFITSDDPKFMAKCIILSGSYMLYGLHEASPASKYFENIRNTTPNLSARMDALRAAILRPQLEMIEGNIEGWISRYNVVASYLTQNNKIVIPTRHERTRFVPSSIQFRLPGIKYAQAEAFVSNLKSRGVGVKWFGGRKAVNYTSSHKHWEYFEGQDLPQTDAVLSSLFDMRLPLTFTLDDCRLLGEILVEEIMELDIGDS